MTPLQWFSSSRDLDLVSGHTAYCPQIVLDNLKKLKMNKAPGVDLIGTRTLTELSEVVCDIVAEIYNKSLCTGDIHDEWRPANVTAVFKRKKVISVKLQTY